jgi:hypothetical protein
MCDPAQEVDNLGKSGQKLISDVNKTADNIIRNPLPVIETVALTWALGPEGYALATETTAAAIASAAVSAANGGKLENIALAAATAYAGAQIGSEAASYLPPGTSNTLKQIVASSSGSAATAALRGGGLTSVIASGVSGAVSSYVSEELKTAGYTKVDNKLITNATNAATKAILQGKDVSAAISSSLVSTGLTAAISGRADQINKNNELGQSLATKAQQLAATGQDFLTNSLTPLETTAKAQYDQAIKDQQAYNETKVKFDEAYKTYSDNKALYEADNSKTTAYDAANAAATKANELAPTLTKLGDTMSASVAAYNETAGRYTTVKQQFENTYINPLADLNKQVTDINAQNETLTKATAEDYVKYNQDLQTQADVLAKNISTEATANPLEKFGLPEKPVDVIDEKVPTRFTEATGPEGTEITATADRPVDPHSLEIIPSDLEKKPDAITAEAPALPAKPETPATTPTSPEVKPTITTVNADNKLISLLNPSLQKSSAPIDASQIPVDDGTIGNTTSTGPKATWLGGIKKVSPMYNPLASVLPDSYSYDSLAPAAPAPASFFSYGSETKPADNLFNGSTNTTSPLATTTNTTPVQQFAAGGQVMNSPLMAAAGGVPHKGSHYVQGAGGGQDDLVDAKLADGEYVFDAEIVSALGDGSNKEGARKLDAMRESIRRHKRSAPLNTIPPKAKSPLAYLKGIK